MSYSGFTLELPYPPFPWKWPQALSEPSKFWVQLCKTVTPDCCGGLQCDSQLHHIQNNLQAFLKCSS